MKTPIKGAALKVITEVPDVSLLREILNHVATGAVEVDESSNTITCDEADLETIRVTLSDLGIEVSEEVQATTEGDDPAAAGAGAAPAGDPAAAGDAGAGAANPDPANPNPGAVAGADDGAITEDALFEEAGKVLDEAPEVSGVLQASKSGSPSWLLVANGEPVARVCLEDQANPEVVSAFFQKPEYLNTVLQAMNKHGAAKALKSLKASVFTAKAVRASEEVDLDEVAKVAVAKYRHALSMAFTAANKNVMAGNSLKAAAFAALADQVDDPEAVVEQIFAEGENFLTELDAQAQEYAQLDDSALAATHNMLRKISAQRAGTVSASPAKSTAAAAMTRKLTAGNMPLTTAGADGIPDDGQAGDLTLDPSVQGTIGGVDRGTIRASLSSSLLGGRRG